MWMWTSDERLINTDLVESISLYPNIPDDADVEEYLTGELEADYFELVAHTASGDEAVLYETEDEEQAQLAYTVLAVALAFAAGGDAELGAPFSVQDLLDEHRKQSN